MKCLKDTKTGSVYKVEDKRAEELVTKGMASYISREEYMEAQDKASSTYKLGALPPRMSRHIHLIVDQKVWERYAAKCTAEKKNPYEDVVSYIHAQSKQGKERKPAQKNEYMADHA